ncbi:hypothetical protein ACDY99_30065 [Achromobacter dolens]|uniref:hypothetical protein n=1 Tax=Achromobacter dolens TaxID=1287738 RepID=UPI003556C431
MTMQTSIDNIVAFAAWQGLPCVFLRRPDARHWRVESPRTTVDVLNEHDAGMQFYRECLAYRFLLVEMAPDPLKDAADDMALGMHVVTRSDDGERVLAQTIRDFEREQETLLPVVLAEVRAWVAENPERVQAVKAGMAGG